MSLKGDENKGDENGKDYRSRLVDIPLDNYANDENDDINLNTENDDINLNTENDDRNKKRNPIIKFLMSYILFPLMFFPLMFLIFILSCGYVLYTYIFSDGLLDNIPGVSTIKKL